MTAIFKVEDFKIEARPHDAPPIPIVKGVSFEIGKGHVVALIGESGSGKTTISLSSLGYTKPGLHFSGGKALLLDKDMITLDPEDKRLMRGEHVAYLAQSAAATFNPALKIGEQVIESAVLHGSLSREQAEARAVELYRALELPDPDRIGGRYPHQVSGGQLQRLMAAMARALVLLSEVMVDLIFERRPLAPRRALAAPWTTALALAATASAASNSLRIAR